MRARIGGAVLALLVALVGALAQHAAPPWEKNHLQIGQALYRDNGIVCHDIDTPTSKKFGPSFYRLFQQPKMPLSNMKPDRGYIKIRVKFGGPLMPSFQKRLNGKEIDTMIDYIVSR